MTTITPFSAAGVRGFLHRPAKADGAGLVLTHGAGADCEGPVPVAAAHAFTAAGLVVLRCDLPFRQQRPSGPPPRGSGAADRAGLRSALAEMRRIVPGPVFLGGHSYGGRMASMLAAEDPEIAKALLLLSYPLHPPKKPDQLRTDHFPDLRTRAVFVHGTVDGFGTISELKAAIAAIPAVHTLIPVDGAGHDLRRGRIDFAAPVAAVLEAAEPRPVELARRRP
jgi:predicted alpha/beta-hydrolase family hydrolase